MKRILIRARSGINVGEGHVMRSRAVADEVLAAGGEVLFVVDDEEHARRLAVEGLETLSAREQPDWASIRCQAAWIDGFADWTEELRALSLIHI